MLKWVRAHTSARPGRAVARAQARLPMGLTHGRAGLVFCIKRAGRPVARLRLLGQFAEFARLAHFLFYFFIYIII